MTGARDDDLLPLEACAELGTDRVGRKASVLAWAAQQGLATPGGLVMPASRFWTALQAAGVHEQARYLAAAALRLDPRHTADLAGAIRAALDCPAVRILAGTCAGSASRRLTARPLVARSSAVVEDGCDASFPGVFLSRLHLTTTEELADAIASCWRSAFAPPNLQYLLRMRVEPVDFSIAVLIQPQVQADWYGLYVSADPVSGAATPVVELTREGPDALVGGSIAMTRAQMIGGRWAIEPDDPALAPALARVSALASRLSARVPGHLDIEFALPAAGAEPVLLQCRPVTPARASGVHGAGRSRGAHIVGRPCAPGVVTGIALAPGEPAAGSDPRIALVEGLTTDDYDLVFRYGGIVAVREVSPLSHAAILCRELGVPLVSGVGAGIVRLAGRWVQLDGGSGVVGILPGAPKARADSRLEEDVLYVTDVECELLQLASCGLPVGSARGSSPEASKRRRLGARRSQVLAVPLAPAEARQLASLARRSAD